MCFKFSTLRSVIDDGGLMVYSQIHNDRPLRKLLHICGDFRTLNSTNFSHRFRVTLRASLLLEVSNCG